MTEETKTASVSNSALSALLAEHPYYCSENNYFSNDASSHWDTMTEFLDEMEDADIDMNLCFRWDIKRNTDDETGEPVEGCNAEVFIMKQRKGLFSPHRIDSVNEKEAIRFREYAEKHWKVLCDMWQPICSG